MTRRNEELGHSLIPFDILAEEGLRELQSILKRQKERREKGNREVPRAFQGAFSESQLYPTEKGWERLSFIVNTWKESPIYRECLERLRTEIIFAPPFHIVRDIIGGARWFTLRSDKGWGSDAGLYYKHSNSSGAGDPVSPQLLNSLWDRNIARGLIRYVEGLSEPQIVSQMSRPLQIR